MQEYTPTPDFYNDYIAHHGILGMKWGKKNGPPYPLGSDVSTGHRLKNSNGSVKKKKPQYPIQDPELKGLKQTGKHEWTYTTIDGDVIRMSGPLTEKQRKIALKQEETARKKKKPDRHERAANASARDAEDLRKHGYTKEADAVQKVSDQQRAKSKTANKNSNLTNQESDAVQKQVDSNTISTEDWNKTPTYSKGFLEYISWQVGSPEQVDDPELLALLAMEYEAGTGKAARKDGNFYLSDDAAKEYGVSKRTHR